MNLTRPNKNLEQQIQLTVKPMLCPIHNKAAQIKMPNENEEVEVQACCIFFKNDVVIVGERMRKDFLYKAQKTRERLEKERIRTKFGNNN